MKDMYSSLIELGYTQNQIDEMDIIYHMKLLAHRKANRKTKGKGKQSNQSQVTIDQIPGF
ncbi:hypothetical protein J2Z83_000066 [Virgibacillus natechei]|uniref:Phage protein n=1 Tax=Virgibacillus natechei TaxID=1216297 RepID=A0ABS4ID45_9BACI|nr:hypothetical protein [Virgibacillus natechei]MBP1967974.1 hypothetical protein [Virgibacillus natechei]UZD15005.1 hypothetical protein OLD84_09660 [Virgibacillus natechei]